MLRNFKQVFEELSSSQRLKTLSVNKWSFACRPTVGNYPLYILKPTAIQWLHSSGYGKNCEFCAKTTLCWDILGDAKEGCWSMWLGLTDSSLCSTSLVQVPSTARQTPRRAVPDMGLCSPMLSLGCLSGAPHSPLRVHTWIIVYSVTNQTNSISYSKQIVAIKESWFPVLLTLMNVFPLLDCLYFMYRWLFFSFFFFHPFRNVIAT